MAEKLLVKEVSVASPFGLRERRKLPGWERAMYYLVLEDSRFLPLELSHDRDSFKVAVYGAFMGTLAGSQRSGQPIRLTRGDGTRLIGATHVIYASSRELYGPEVAKLVREGPEALAQSSEPQIVEYEELYVYDIMTVGPGTYFYVATKGGRVYAYTVLAVTTKHLLVEVLVDARQDPKRLEVSRFEPRASMLTVGGTVWTVRRVPNRRSPSYGQVGPIAVLIGSSKELTATEIRNRYNLPGRHGRKPR